MTNHPRRRRGNDHDGDRPRSPTGAPPWPDGYDPGFDGLIMAGVPPEQAWSQMADVAAGPEAAAIIAALGDTPEGRAVLDWSRQSWAARGLRPPWDPDPATDPPPPERGSPR
jgi:hypothetical protein